MIRPQDTTDPPPEPPVPEETGLPEPPRPTLSPRDLQPGDTAPSTDEGDPNGADASLTPEEPFDGREPAPTPAGQDR